MLLLLLLLQLLLLWMTLFPLWTVLGRLSNAAATGERGKNGGRAGLFRRVSLG
jgi:hypothetical protein